MFYTIFTINFVIIKTYYIRLPVSLFLYFRSYSTTTKKQKTKRKPIRQTVNCIFKQVEVKFS